MEAAERASTKMAQINPGHTQFDRLADLNIHEAADPVFEELMKLEEKS